jgi:tRNA-specific 2-thiouridylase
VREYWNEVFDPCLKKWEKGVETPNPDILCNEKIKFHHLLNWSKKKGFSNIATGHYVRNYNNGEGLMRGIQPKDTFSRNKNIHAENY